MTYSTNYKWANQHEGVRHPHAGLHLTLLDVSQ
jgi:hypothetical protein